MKICKWIMICGGILTALLWIGMVVIFFLSNPFPTTPWLPLCASGIIALPITIALVVNGIKSQEPVSILDLPSHQDTQEGSDYLSSEEGTNDEKGNNNVEPKEEEASQSLKEQLTQLQTKIEKLQNNNDELNKQIGIIQGQKKEIEQKFTQSQETNQELLNRLEPKWSKAMYKLYCEKWNNYFDQIGMEIEDTKKVEFLKLLWNIASQTMDFLIFANNDPNYLKINENITNAIIEGKSISEVEHKKFFEDPNTIEKKALAVYNFFKSQLADGQDMQISAFGYDIHINNKK